MQVNPITSTSFESKNQLKLYTLKAEPRKINTFRLALKDGKKAIVTVEENDKYLMTKIAYDILDKGKVVERKNYINKDGFDMEVVTTIVQNIQSRVKNGIDFMEELIKAQLGNMA